MDSILAQSRLRTRVPLAPSPMLRHSRASKAPPHREPRGRRVGDRRRDLQLNRAIRVRPEAASHRVAGAKRGVAATRRPARSWSKSTRHPASTCSTARPATPPSRPAAPTNRPGSPPAATRLRDLQLSHGPRLHLRHCRGPNDADISKVPTPTRCPGLRGPLYSTRRGIEKCGGCRPARCLSTPADFGSFDGCVHAVLASCTHLPDLRLRGAPVGWSIKCKRPGQTWCAARDLNPEPAD
jgi:hypothetical protein